MKKINNLSLKKKILLLIYLIVIFLALFFLVKQDKVIVVEYEMFGINVCNETYKNGKLITDMCEQNKRYNIFHRKWNDQFLKDLENSILNQTLT